jgi:DNA-binding MarR family transcriptional regulator
MGNGKYDLQPDDSVFVTWAQLYYVVQAIFRTRDLELRKHAEVRASQAGVLYILKHQQGPVTISKLSELLLREKHSVVGLINRMEKAGLVIRDGGSLGDKRLKPIKLTKKGRHLVDSISKSRVIHTIILSLGEDDIVSFRSCLRRMLKAALQERTRLEREGL